MYHVADIEYLDSALTECRLVARILAILLLMPADRAVHRRSDQLSKQTNLGCVPPDDEAKVGAPLVGLLIDTAFGAWTFSSLAPEALPRDALGGILTLATLQW